MLPEKEREMSLCFNLTQTVTLLMVNCVMIGLELERRGKSLSTHRWACSCFLHGSSCNHRLQAACTEEGRRGSVGQTWSCFYKTLLCWDLGEGGRTRLVPCLILPLASATIHRGDWKHPAGRCFLLVCCYFWITFSSSVSNFLFPLT